MNHIPPLKKYMDLYNPESMPLPDSWNQFNEDRPFPFLMNWLPPKHGDKSGKRIP